ncbi:uncharacterized protein LOC144746207 [Ciona intestinalis]
MRSFGRLRARFFPRKKEKKIGGKITSSKMNQTTCPPSGKDVSTYANIPDSRMQNENIHSRSTSLLSSSSSVWDTDCLVAADAVSCTVPPVLAHHARGRPEDDSSEVTDDLLTRDPFTGIRNKNLKTKLLKPVRIKAGSVKGSPERSPRSSSPRKKNRGGVSKSSDLSFSPRSRQKLFDARSSARTRNKSPKKSFHHFRGMSSNLQAFHDTQDCSSGDSTIEASSDTASTVVSANFYREKSKTARPFHQAKTSPRSLP